MTTPYKVHVHVCGTYAGAYEFATLAEAEADMADRKKWEVLGCHYRLEGPCPKCNGVADQPEIVGCAGCMACDFTGTFDGYHEMQRLEHLARASNPDGALYCDDDSRLPN